MRAHWLIGGLVVLVLGCGNSRKLAPVSGVVKMDGRPLAGATVGFEPLESDKGPNDNPTTSGAKTDENGAYTLETYNGDRGALVGKHKVKISLYKQMQDPDSDARRRSGPLQVDKVPERYNKKTQLTIDVPPEGKTDANFDLKSK
jgi:hypothetical protein